MRIWVKVFDDNAHMIGSETIEDYSEETRTHKVFNGLQVILKPNRYQFRQTSKHSNKKFGCGVVDIAVIYL